MRQLLTLALLLVATVVQAATYYVTPTGNDATPCAQAQNAGAPRRTIAAGIACLSSGDTLMVGGGTYAEGPLPALPSGQSASQRTTLRAMPGASVLVTPAQQGPDNSTAVINAAGRYLLIEGINVDAQFNMASMVSLDSDTIILCNMNLQGGWGQGVNGVATHSQFLHLEVHHTGQYCHPHGDTYCPYRGYHHGFYLQAGGAENIFDHVYVHDIPDGHGLQLYASAEIVQNSRITNIAYGMGIWFLSGGTLASTSATGTFCGDCLPIAGHYSEGSPVAVSSCEGGTVPPPKPRLPAPTRLRLVVQP
jgi:hypothetical protein